MDQNTWLGWDDPRRLLRELVSAAPTSLENVTPTIASLTDTELRRAFDSGSLSRGKLYAHAGRVTISSLGPDGDAASGEVRGTDPQVYSTTVQVRETRAGGTHVVATCSCPVGFGCKHAVALIIAVRGAIEPEVDAEPTPDLAPVVTNPSWQRRARGRHTGFRPGTGRCIWPARPGLHRLWQTRRHRWPPSG